MIHISKMNILNVCSSILINLIDEKLRQHIKCVRVITGVAQHVIISVRKMHIFSYIIYSVGCLEILRNFWKTRQPNDAVNLPQCSGESMRLSKCFVFRFSNTCLKRAQVLPNARGINTNSLLAHYDVSENQKFQTVVCWT